MNAVFVVLSNTVVLHQYTAWWYKTDCKERESFSLMTCKVYIVAYAQIWYISWE